LARSLPHHPKLGRIVPEFARDDVRERFVYSYRVIYQVRDEVLVVVNVIHGRGGWPDGRALADPPHIGALGLATAGTRRYERHRPETTLLYQLVERHCPDFLATLAARAMRLAGCLVYLFAMAIFWWAVPHAHRARLALAFDPGCSGMLLQEGPWRFVRHPFYAAYLLYWIAGVLVTGQWLLIVSVLVVGGFYAAAIRCEEAELAARPDLPGYAAYRDRTGCLIPRLTVSGRGPR
jgi:protein-S-isoprenylcysteine O-methyltransferase Ste14